MLRNSLNASCHAFGILSLVKAVLCKYISFCPLLTRLLADWIQHLKHRSKSTHIHDESLIVKAIVYVSFQPRQSSTLQPKVNVLWACKTPQQANKWVNCGRSLKIIKINRLPCCASGVGRSRCTISWLFIWKVIFNFDTTYDNGKSDNYAAAFIPHGAKTIKARDVLLWLPPPPNQKILFFNWFFLQQE